jgi:CobQ-like glutamine amidotransferase family enzyme
VVKIYHLYPDLLDLYGDRGNVMALVKRCEWRNLPVQVKEIRIGDIVDFSGADIVFMGGGSDREQNLLAEDLGQRLENLRQAIEGGLVMLAICGGYQLLGSYYLAADGAKVTGLGLLDFYTEAGPDRLIGNVGVEIELNGKKVLCSGFENHSGRTFLGRVQPLGRVLAGHGNNGQDGLEGARYRNVFCSYLHGPLLPKNPALADYLLSLALGREEGWKGLGSLDDTLENTANEVMLKRIMNKR